MTQDFQIIVLSGVSIGDIFNFSLEGDASITIGRAETNDIVLSDPRVSRTHAGVILRDNRLELQDLGSASGTVHMGFKIETGANGARSLSSGDEFKVGDSLFRVQFEQVTPVETGETEFSSEARTNSGGFDIRSLLQNKKYVGLAGVAALLLVLLLFAPSDSGPTLPKQVSATVLELPEYRLLGYWPGKKSTAKSKKDSSRIDKVQFYVPTSNVLIEYDYLSEVEINVLVDGTVYETLPPSPSGWRHQQLIIRDVLEGKRRVLVFDNTSYPRKKKSKNHKRWAVTNVRATPLVKGVDDSLEKAISEAAAQAPDYDKTADGLFRLIRSMQQVTLENIIESGADAVAVTPSIDEDGSGLGLDGEEIQDVLHSMLEELRESAEIEVLDRHLFALRSSLGRLEGELWRRYNSRVRKARYSAKAKNSIVVYDNLVAVKAMFPDETDYRWVKAERMLNDKRYVPKKVRENPGRYRR